MKQVYEMCGKPESQKLPIHLHFKGPVQNIGDVKTGSTVRIGDRNYIVLQHYNNVTSIVAESPVTNMLFGETNDYRTSFVRDYCNRDFYEQLCKEVGAENIIPHIVDLQADDGSNNGVMVTDNVSILTTTLYRHFRDMIPLCGNWEWTPTKVTIIGRKFANKICGIDNHGFLSWGDSTSSEGKVRPFVNLRSNTHVIIY